MRVSRAAAAAARVHAACGEESCAARGVLDGGHISARSVAPMGLPPESSRSCATNFMSPAGEEKALWRGGELQSDLQ